MVKPSNPTKIKYVVINDEYEYYDTFDSLEEAIAEIEGEEDEILKSFVIYEVTRQFNYKPPTDITYNWVEV